MGDRRYWATVAIALLLIALMTYGLVEGWHARPMRLD